MEGVSGEGGTAGWGVDWVLLGGGWILEESEILVRPSLKEYRVSPFYDLKAHIKITRFLALSNPLQGAVLDESSF